MYVVTVSGTEIAKFGWGAVAAPDVWQYGSFSGTYHAQTTGIVELKIAFEPDMSIPTTQHAKLPSNHCYIDNIRLYPEDASFDAVKSEISAAEGGAFKFHIHAGAANGGRSYMVLQGVSGNDPGFNLAGGSVHVPLNVDAWTLLSLNLNSYWMNFYGLLDANGEADLQMSTFGPQPGAERLSITLVALLMDNTGFKPVGCTNPVYVLFTP
jgi:hypothetical protein